MTPQLILHGTPESIAVLHIEHDITHYVFLQTAASKKVQKRQNKTNSKYSILIYSQKTLYVYEKNSSVIFLFFLENSKCLYLEFG